MIQFFEKNKRGISFLLLIAILNTVVFPAGAYALTSGPAQPEASSFTPVSTSDMVNLFSGDLNYNIPLLDVGGYPVNISYTGGSFMDQEATWVGLGWNINAGAINRNMRGLPDDFNGENVLKEVNMKPNETYGVTIGGGGEIFGIDAINANYSLGVTYNNYTGYGISQSIGISISPEEGFPGTIGLGLSSSADGLTISPKVTFKAKLDENGEETLNGSVSIGTSFNSRTGLKTVTLDAGLSSSSPKKNGSSTSYSGDENKHSNSAGLYSKSASYDMGMATYVPQVTMPMHNQSYLFSFALGGTLFGTDLTANITGNYSKQSLQYQTTSVPAYGYMYQENAEDLDKAMLDFNREKDGPFSENSVALPLTNNTYDIYSVAGQGVGGSYRLFRSDIGYVFDSRATTDSESDALSGDLSLGNAVQGGINYYNTNMDQTSGKWTDNNAMAAKFHFAGKKINTDYEPAYFKEAGEMTIEEDNLYNSVQTNKSVRFDIGDAGYETYTLPKFRGEDGSSFNVPSTNKRTKRAKRNQLLSYVTKKDYKAGALDRSLYSLIPAAVPDHHVAEISTTKTDGTRYVYGLPVFNTKQVEKSFNVSGNTITNNIAAIGSGDDTPGNSKGIDNFYTSTELPAFAYSYLLTAVLSPDYVDITGNGPSDDDLGTYTKFEYDTPANYNWRTPVSSGATYDIGLRSEPNDDKGSYIYGEKQITYLKKITTKNYVAVFDLQNRQDGRGVANASGGSLGSTQKLLEAIRLYSRPDFTANGTNAFVIKQVNFVYDYSLCYSGTNVPNNAGGGTLSAAETANQGGKLTLKKIFFTYGKSKKAHLSPYEFSYNTTALDASHTTINPGYNVKSYDRWGTYKPDQVSGMPNTDYPYVEQDKVTADSYAGLWNLKQITLPSGGKITVDLESDDYAYVQNKRATQMFKIVGSDKDIPTTLTGVAIPANNKLFDFDIGAGGYVNYTTLYFKLNEPIDYSVSGNINTAKAIFQKEYINGVNDLYFRFLTNVNGSTTYSGQEYVSGYGQIWNSGVVNSSSGPANKADYGWIQLKEVSRGDKDGNFSIAENPISKATWQFGRMHTPQSVFSATGQPANPSGGIGDFLTAMANASFFKNTLEFFLGMYGTMKEIHGYGKYFEKDKSWVKLNNPKRKMLGGGHRVKQITMSDEWSSMLSTTNPNNAGKTFSYGQSYSYTTNDADTDYPVSSGVAAYEPAFGADENPCRFPIYNPNKKDELLLAPDNDLYLEGPYGESFFPSPGVGYSKVTVKNLDHSNVSINATGRVVNEFYTARDFPVIVKQPTDLYIKRLKSNPLQKLLSMNFTDNITASQGYCIELNDMHGKQKGMSVYDAKDNKISGVTYYYRQNGNELDNEVPVMAKDGSITKKTIGIDFDMVTDFREQKSTSQTVGVQGNLYFMMIGIFPLFVPPIIPSFKMESIRFRSAGITKVVHHFGIVEKTVAEDLGSTVETSNLLWDGETGQTMLTNTNTEFKDNLYNFNYPGYFAYSGMEPAYKNTGMEFDLSALANASTGTNYGKVNVAYSSYLEAGDELIVIDKSTGQPVNTSSSNSNDSRCWVRKQGTDYYLIDKTGAILFAGLTGTNYTVKLIRSGKRNQQSLSAGNLVTFNAPVDVTLPSTSWPLIDGTKNVLNASAVEYGDAWGTFCSCGIATVGNNTNEYLAGMSGNFRQKKNYAYLTLRSQTNVNSNSNIRRDGVFEKFDPFWMPNGGGNWLKPGYLNTPASKWTWASEVTQFSPYGTELENRDALNRYSAAVYGYNNSLPVAVGSNTKYRQMAADNFEDYGYGCAASNHFSFNTTSLAPLTYVTGTGYQKYAHSGNKSIKVTPGQTGVKVTKDLKPCQ